MKFTRLILPFVPVCFIVAGYCWWQWGIEASTYESGSVESPEGAGWSHEHRMRTSEERARTLRDAIIAFRTAQGELPKSLDSLVPTYLTSLPVPATTTMPFEFIVEPKGNFRVCWEPWPNTSYQRIWVDQDGKLAGDT